MKRVRTNIVESALYVMPHLTAEETADVLEFLSGYLDKYKDEIIATGAGGLEELTEPENSFTRFFVKFFLGLDDGIKPIFIADILEVLDKWKDFSNSAE
jgi:hypothetical protein